MQARNTTANRMTAGGAEARLRLALEATQLGLWEFERRTGTLELSPGARRILDFNPDEAGSFDAWRRRIHPQDRSQVEQSFTGLEQSDSFEAEYRLRLRDGSYRWIRDRGTAVRDLRGKILRIIGISEDITDRHHAHRELRDREQRLQLALDASRLYMWTFDPATRRVQADDALCELLAMDAEARRRAACWLRRIHTDDRQHTLRAFRAALYGRRSLDLECRIDMGDGALRWFQVQAILVRDESLRLYGVCGDITERKRHEQALREREDQLRTITDAVPVGITRCSREMRFLFVNRSYADLLEVSRDVILNRSLVELLGEVRFERIWPYVQRVLAGERVQYESKIQTGSGERVLHTDYVPDIDANGEIFGWISVITDITERKEAEARLYQREREFKTLVENAPDVIARLDRELRHVYVNRAVESAFGVDAALVIGRTVEQLQLPDEVTVAMTEAARAAFDTVMEQSARFALERDGEQRNYAARVIPECDREGRVDSVLVIIYDVTERLRAQRDRERLLEREHAAREQAEAAARARDQFLAIVSHELRSPLNGIQSWAHVLESRIDLSIPGVQRALIGIKAGVEQQVRLIDDLLDATRIMSGKLSIVKQPVLVQPVVEAALSSVRAAAQRKNIRIHTELKADSAQISGDPDRLQQIVWNLLSNAVKFTPAGGNIWLRVVTDEGRLRLTVRDNGKGIAADFLPHMFDWFHRDETANSRGQDGLGLGLALVKHLCELLGGSVSAASEGPGQGASFTLELPLRVPAPVARDALHRREQLPPEFPLPRLEGVRVLLVDDQAETRESIGLLLEQAGAQVVTCGSSEEALQRLMRGLVVDVLVSDIAMPGEDGYSLLRKIRSREQSGAFGTTQRLPAIALTALAQREDRLRALAAGFQMHLAKPVSPAELIVVIATVTRRLHTDATGRVTLNSH